MALRKPTGGSPSAGSKRMPNIKVTDLHTWATKTLTTVGVKEKDAAHIAQCLIDVDKRGVKSHGTRQLRRYVKEFQNGEINPAPEIRVLRETDQSVRLDGDGGAGYLVATQGVDAACAKSKDVGIAVASTCNHGHVGSEGIYARRALAHGLISWCVAGGTHWSRTDEANATVWNAMHSPPMCMAVPSDDGGPPLVLDMNANQFGRSDTAEAAIAAGYGKSVFGSLGMRFISTLVGGVLSGDTGSETERVYKGANRGFVFIALDPDTVGDGTAFKKRAREVIDESLTLPPMAGTDASALPGTLEWRRERACESNGVPIPNDHQEMLEQIARDFTLDPPKWM